MALVLIYLLPFKMHVSERLSDFNSRHCDEIMVVQDNVSPAFSNKLYQYSVIISHRNDEVILLKRFCDGAKNNLRGVIYTLA
ncbi:MAG: hypothetical protein GY928_13440 [Colwellia sp.]|nr:hypothetical protein [Colwellia sp.]